jgi:plasmid stability protein
MQQEYHYSGCMTKYTMRFPDELYARLKAAAAADRRSIHEEVLWLLETALTSRNAPASPDS